MKTDWKKSGVDRRDARATKSPNEVPKPTAAKKNTKKWCKGKVGTAHKPICLVYSEAKHADPRCDFYKEWRLLACSVCGKELDSYHPLGMDAFEGRPKPEWVDK